MDKCVQGQHVCQLVLVETEFVQRMLEEWLTGTEKVPAVLKVSEVWAVLVELIISKDFTMHHGPDSVHFKVEMTAAGMKAAEAQGLENYFKLTSNISTSNMMLFDSDGRIKKFSSAEEVIEDFYPIRIKYYQMRKVMKLAHVLTGLLMLFRTTWLAS